MPKNYKGSKNSAIKPQDTVNVDSSFDRDK